MLQDTEDKRKERRKQKVSVSRHKRAVLRGSAGSLAVTQETFMMSCEHWRWTRSCVDTRLPGDSWMERFGDDSSSHRSDSHQSLRWPSLLVIAYSDLQPCVQSLCRHTQTERQCKYWGLPAWEEGCASAHPHWGRMWWYNLWVMRILVTVGMLWKGQRMRLDRN